MFSILKMKSLYRDKKNADLFAQLKSCIYICNQKVAQLNIKNETRSIPGHS